MKLWMKTVLGEKITRSLVYQATTVDEDTFEICLREMCHTLDVPTPIVTSVNVSHFLTFNVVKFKPRDFIESVDFDFLEVEFVRENKKNR